MYVAIQCMIMYILAANGQPLDKLGDNKIEVVDTNEVQIEEIAEEKVSDAVNDPLNALDLDDEDEGPKLPALEVSTPEQCEKLCGEVSL